MAVRKSLMATGVALRVAAGIAVGIAWGTAPSARADTLRIGTGNFPPYFSEKGTAGLFNDLIREVFALMPEHQLLLVPQMSNYRLVRALNTGAIDGGANIFAATQIKGCRTDGVFRFTDVAISRVDSQLAIETVADLSGKRIVTYQGAKEFLGEAFASAMAADGTEYRESPQPLLQLHALVHGKADVSIGDLYIFLHGVKESARSGVQVKQFAIHSLFPDIYSHMAFREQRHCDAFNVALKKLRKSGGYEALYEKYLRQLRPAD